jgi:uncharacterized membrane protein
MNKYHKSYKYFNINNIKSIYKSNLLFAHSKVKLLFTLLLMLGFGYNLLSVIVKLLLCCSPNLLLGFGV